MKKENILFNVFKKMEINRAIKRVGGKGKAEGGGEAWLCRPAKWGPTQFPQSESFSDLLKTKEM